MSTPTKLFAGGLLLALGCCAGWFGPALISHSGPDSRSENSAAPVPHAADGAQPSVEPLATSPRTIATAPSAHDPAAIIGGAASQGTPGPQSAPEPTEVVIDKPEGDYAILALDKKSSLRLRGKVSVLTIGNIRGGATLDASQLEAHQINVTGNIDGGSIVRLNCPRGNVQFRGKVDGRSWMEVYAPGGRVSFDGPSGFDFANPSNPGDPGAAIQGDSHVSIHAQEVRIEDINGLETHVLVTLGSGGRLRFVEMRDAARLELHKATPGDPDPTVEAGMIHGTAAFKKSY